MNASAEKKLHSAVKFNVNFYFSKYSTSAAADWMLFRRRAETKKFTESRLISLVGIDGAGRWCGGETI